jgi:lipopolysaccharide/colanic/teichoic acid biosynthesis glycosyltransferase
MTSTLYTRFGKRFLDVLLSFLGLVVLSPFLLLIAVAVRLSSRGPALFRQVRTGRFDKPFRILKFRTMREFSSGSLVTAAGDPRITPLGKWLRKTKVDELPQLFNVLAGDMSVVGPRPEVPLYTARYSAHEKQVLAARPGITGPAIIMNEEELMAAQVDREAFYVSVIMPAKLKIDLAYCEHVRFGEDVHVIFTTLARLGAKLLNVIGLASADSGIDRSKIKDGSSRQTLP